MSIPIAEQGVSPVFFLCISRYAHLLGMKSLETSNPCIEAVRRSQMDAATLPFYILVSLSTGREYQYEISCPRFCLLLSILVSSSTRSGKQRCT